MDNQEQEQNPRQDQREKKRGAIDYANDTYRTARNINQSLREIRVVTQVVNKLSWFARLGPVGWTVLIIGILMLLILIIDGGGFSAGGGGGGGSSQTGGGNTGGGGAGGSGDIAACSFYRGNLLPEAAQYKSPTLISYIEDAAELSGVPASVLAAVARVETPTLTNLTDETLSNYSCPVSPDGAMGPLQVVVHYSSRTDAICRDCIDVGAKLLGKNVDDLTQADYCDLKSGFVIGAGFILKKMQYNYSTASPTWDPAWTTSQDAMYELANSFYGCLGYPSCTSGPYNYGEDVWNSVQYCKPSENLASASCPIPNGIVTCGSENTPRGGCGHCNADYRQKFDPNNISCSYPQTHYAIDIGGEDFQDVFLPTINGHRIKWTFTREESRGPNESIKGYAGEDTEDPSASYFLQLHHVDPGGSPGTTYYSGDVGAKICGNCNGKRHVHVELGTGGTALGSVTWVDAAQFFCTDSNV